MTAPLALSLPGGDLAAPMPKAHPLEAGPGPVGWEVESYRRSFGEGADFSASYVSLFRGHPEAPEGREWRGYCTRTYAAPQLEEWFATAAEAMAAVETHVAAAVAEHANAGGAR